MAATVALMVAAGWTAGPAARQQPQAAPQQAPRQVFRSARELISVDVIVRDRSGAIVRGLAAADFEVKGGGRDPVYAVERCVLTITGQHARNRT